LLLTLHEAVRLALKQNPLLDFAIPVARGPILIYGRIELSLGDKDVSRRGHRRL
jgi:hypothetical protein